MLKERNVGKLHQSIYTRSANNPWRTIFQITAHNECTSNMAVWFYAQLTDVSAPLA